MNSRRVSDDLIASKRFDCLTRVFDDLTRVSDDLTRVFDDLIASKRCLGILTFVNSAGGHGPARGPPGRWTGERGECRGLEARGRLGRPARSAGRCEWLRDGSSFGVERLPEAARDSECWRISIRVERNMDSGPGV